MKKLLAKNTKLKQINLKKIKHDPNFLSTIKILNSNKIPYWACHGTLLGIIRDNDLIPWDHDIDIAVWYKKNIKEIFKKIMIKENYKIKKKANDDLLTFIKKGGREIDINFYHQKIENSKKIVYVKWFVP